MSASIASGTIANTITFGVELAQKRKQTFSGTRVLVCGKVVRKLKGKTLICLLPADISHAVHTTLAIDDEGYLVIGHRKEGSDETIWQGLPTLDE